jgi:hypothetical protein
MLTVRCRDPKLILDDKGRIIVILLGTPEDPEWPNVVKEALKVFVRARRKAQRYGAWRAEASHRRGGYFAITTGVSFGGGQRVRAYFVCPMYDPPTFIPRGLAIWSITSFSANLFDASSAIRAYVAWRAFNRVRCSPGSEYS